MQAIQGRRSIRRYFAEEVPRETIEAILRAGIQAPSAKNRQPWSFVVATGRAKSEALDAMEIMSLAAMEQGLGSLWICNTFFAQRELVEWLKVAGELYAAMAVGYANENPQARPRKRLEDVAVWRE